MANQVYPLTVSDEPSLLFVATQNGPIQRSDNSSPIRSGLVVIDSESALALALAAPRPGPQIQGGDDGSILTLVVGASTPSVASYVTHVITSVFTEDPGLTHLNILGKQGERVSLIAWNGSWIVLTSTAAVTS